MCGHKVSSLRYIDLLRRIMSSSSSFPCIINAISLEFYFFFLVCGCSLTIWRRPQSLRATWFRTQLLGRSHHFALYLAAHRLKIERNLYRFQVMSSNCTMMAATHTKWLDFVSPSLEPNSRSGRQCINIRPYIPSDVHEMHFVIIANAIAETDIERIVWCSRWSRWCPCQLV